MHIIKNVEVIKGKKEREFVIQLLERGLEFSKPENAIKRAVSLKDDYLYVNDEIFNIKNKNIFVIGFGKAADGMAKVLQGILKNRIKKGIIISPYVSSVKGFEVFKSSHPYPNKNSVIGTKRIISLLKTLGKDDIIIYLVSGGGSASLVMPKEGIRLKDKIKITKMLIESGADIFEINMVRKLLSDVKGGKLLRYSPESEIINIIISDVVGDRIDVISSGPTVTDNTDLIESFGVLKKYNILEDFPQIRKYLKETKIDTKSIRLRNHVILRNIDVLKEIKKIANIPSLILSSRMEGKPEEVGRFLSGICKDVFYNGVPLNKPCLILSGGETTVNIEGKKGKGGTNQELCLHFLLNISKDIKFVFSSIDTDGKDGSSEFAGGIVDEESLNILKVEDIKKGILNHDAQSLLASSNDLILTGFTGTNVNDIQILYVR